MPVTPHAAFISLLMPVLLFIPSLIDSILCYCERLPCYLLEYLLYSSVHWRDKTWSGWVLVRKWWQESQSPDDGWITRVCRSLGENTSIQWFFPSSNRESKGRWNWVTLSTTSKRGEWIELRERIEFKSEWVTQSERENCVNLLIYSFHSYDEHYKSILSWILLSLLFFANSFFFSLYYLLMKLIRC